MASGEVAEAFAWATGRATPFDQAMADALGAGDTSEAEQVPASQPEPSWAPLTPREREVAALIAQGLTNPRIAEALVLSRLTVGTHVCNILRKLGVSSRAQVASWAAAHQVVVARSPAERA